MKSYKPSALKWDFTVYWSFVSTVFAVRTVPTNLLFPTVRTDPLHLLIQLFLPILCSYWSYCSYRSCVPTDPLFLLILLFLPILCSYRSYCSYCSYRSSVLTDSAVRTVPNDPLFLLILCSYWSFVPTVPTYWSSDPNVSTDPLSYCSYWSSVPIPTYWSSAPTVPTDPLFLLLILFP